MILICATCVMARKVWSTRILTIGHYKSRKGISKNMRNFHEVEVVN